MVPVAIGHGDGGETRAPMGVTVIGGLITSTFLTLIVVPVIYTLMEAVSQFGVRVAGWFGSSPAHSVSDASPAEERAAAED
jgi:HAE1 family hydrophobic/amphiphilic exporter-1